MTLRNFTNTATVGALTGPVAASATSVIVGSFSNAPAVPFTATIDRNTPTEEIVLVTAIAGTTLTIVRGYDGTAGQAHSAGAAFEHTAGAIEYTEANAHTNATANAHGATGAIVGNQGAQTLYDKSLVSPVLTADVTKGDAAVAVIPTGATVRNLFRGVGADGNDKIVVDSSGNLTAGGVNLTALNTTVGTNSTNISTANTNIGNLQTGKADKTYTDTQDTATLNSAKSYTDSSVAPLIAKVWRTAGFSSNLSSGTQYTVALNASRLGTGFTFDGTANLTLPSDGIYRVTVRSYYSGGSSTGDAITSVFRTRASVGDVVVVAVNDNKATSLDRTTTASDIVPLKAGDKLWIQANVAACTAGFNYYGTTETQGMALWVERLSALNGATPI